MPAQRKAEMRTRRQDTASQRYQAAKARKACVEAVWKRANSLCEYCGRFVRRTRFWLDSGHVHEVRARSLGGNPHDPKHCKLACVQCHFPSGAHRRSVRAQ